MDVNIICGCHHNTIIDVEFQKQCKWKSVRIVVVKSKNAPFHLRQHEFAYAFHYTASDSHLKYFCDFGKLQYETPYHGTFETAWEELGRNR